MGKLGQEPAFPQPDSFDCQGGSAGISKRLYIATKAMQGIMASNECNIGHAPKTVAKWAYSIADALLEQENQ